MVLKVLAAAILVLVFSGCDYRPAQSKEFTAFVAKHGAATYQYCSKEGFLTEEGMQFTYSTYPDRNLIRDTSNSPVRCAIGVNGEIYE